jgi:hypothetical protein
VKLLLPSVILVSLLVLVHIIAEAKVFKGETYTLTYPAGCKTDKQPNRFTTTLRLECKEDMGIMFENSQVLSDNIQGTEEEMQDTMLQAQDTLHDGVEEVERGNMTIGNQTAPYVIAKYTQEFTNFLGLPSDKTEGWVVMSIAIKTSDGVIVGQYRNNEDDFDKNMNAAKNIFESVTAISPISPKDEKPLA